jgi:KDO2-lipid IV(A) lauroyltransferase
MRLARRRLARSARRALAGLRDAVLGNLAVLVLKAVRLTDPHRMTDFAGRFMRRIGPWLPEHRLGRANLAAAYPEKSAAEIAAILGGVWDNLGRLAAEFAHLDRIWDHDPARPGESHIEFSRESEERFIKLRDDGKGALVFAAHLANWELPALAGAAHGLETAVLFRAPNLGAVARAVQDIRAVSMGTLIQTGLDAPVRIARAIEKGVHVGMLVDQHFVKGVEVTFFGRRCNANPLIALLARQTEAPIHGTRVVRLPGHRFRAELTDEIRPVRDLSGRIDIAGTMQAITEVVEGWIREHPEQWLWVHRRWR